MPSITISYDLHPPEGTPHDPKVVASKTQNFEIKSGSDYYTALRASIAEAKDTLGKELTEWRDQVGDLEKQKDADAKNAKRGEDSEEEDDEQE
jgi:hypothetical protein